MTGPDRADIASGVPRVEDEHYSYTAYADVRMAETFEQARFGGPIGRMLAETQERVVSSFLSPVIGVTVLDVGTGTGRAAIALARRGATVTGVDASAQMLAVARRRAEESGARATFAHGDVHALDMSSQSFDAVVCLRVLMHTPDWRRSLAELCRVASRRVVVDYPALCSAALIEAIGRRAAYRFGARVEAYRVFTDRSMRRAFRDNGFRMTGIHRQFVLPIALHKRLASQRATEHVEAVLAGAGLRRLVGSPVTVVAERCAS